MIEPLIPWTSSGIFMATTLGVPTLAYLPWAVQCYTGIVFAMVWAVTGKGIKYLKDYQHEERVEVNDDVTV